MKLETFSNPSKEIFLQADTISVTVNTWHNMVGCSIMIHGNDAGLPLRMAGAFRWEEVDAIIAALAAARSA